MPAESEADAMEALKNLTEGFESVGGNKYTFKKSEATKAQEAYEKNQKKIASENKKKNSLENAKKKENKSDKWEKNKDYLNRERISMKTPSGGEVSIYESENPKQKNNRFRVNTGDYYNNFNTLEEAKAFAEKEYGGNAPRQLTGDCKITIKG